jgi:hypothetical protein
MFLQEDLGTMGLAGSCACSFGNAGQLVLVDTGSVSGSPRGWTRVRNRASRPRDAQTRRNWGVAESIRGPRHRRMVLMVLMVLSRSRRAVLRPQPSNSQSLVGLTSGNKNPRDSLQAASHRLPPRTCLLWRGSQTSNTRQNGNKKRSVRRHRPRRVRTAKRCPNPRAFYPCAKCSSHPWARLCCSSPKACAGRQGHEPEASRKATSVGTQGSAQPIPGPACRQTHKIEYGRRCTCS